MCVRPIKVRGYEVGCGRCYECQSLRRSEWAFRMQYEFKCNPNAYFLTLTYDDEHLKEEVTNQYTGLYEANRKDIQVFIRELRRIYNLRYFGVHEYGGVTKRKHYHLIVWLTDRDIKLDLATVQRLWKFGFIQKDILNLARIHYCTKYLNKPFRRSYDTLEDILEDETLDYETKKTKLIDSFIKANTFNFMSTRPAIGYQLLDDVELCNYIIESTLQNGNYPKLSLNGREFSIPRFYLKKLFTDKERQAIYFNNLENREKNVELKSKKLDMSICELWTHRQNSDDLKLERFSKNSNANDKL